jgi:ArsR family transcriptional regulator
MDDCERYARFFKVLSDPNRLAIIRMLADGELCACRLLSELSITQPTLSHHMDRLCGCGLVVGRKEGRWMHYRVNKAVVDDLARFLQGLG